MNASPAPTNLRCLIVDDDELSRVMLEQLIRQTATLDLVATCSGPLEALKALQSQTVDLIFLDVEMPELNGLELIRSLGTRPEIVLVTSREHYAVEAFDADVADYIVKPVTLARFLKAIDRVVQKRKRTVETPTSEARLDALFVKVKSQLVRIPWSEITSVESNGDYVTIHTEKGKFTAHSTLKEMETKLPGGLFMRVHRSHIVQLSKIRAIEETTLIVGDALIPIGDKYRATLTKVLNLV